MCHWTQRHIKTCNGASCRAKGSSRADGGRREHSEEDEAFDGILRYPQRDREVSVQSHPLRHRDDANGCVRALGRAERGDRVGRERREVVPAHQQQTEVEMSHRPRRSERVSWQMICFVLSRWRPAFTVNWRAQICFSGNGTDNRAKLRLIASPVRNGKPPRDES